MKTFFKYVSFNLGTILITIGLLMLSSSLMYCLYLEYAPTRYTHNYIILNNVQLKFKSSCEEYNEHQSTMCIYTIKDSDKIIKLPQGKADILINKQGLTFNIKFSEHRHVLFVTYATNDISKPTETIELKREIAETSRYVAYCNTYNIPYCKE
jgi:hypothetical protein